ncbi:MAG: hypothetical protein ABWW65_05905 [Thermoprotei archaeon]
MNKAIIPILAIVAILALIGSALAMWYDVLKIAVTVNTGDVDVEFDTTTTVSEEEHGKPWVANCTAVVEEIEDEDPDNPFGNNDLDLNITIVNGYPSYWCNVTFTVKNVGTIPVKGPYMMVAGQLVAFPTGAVDMDLDGDKTADINVYYDMSPVQIDEDENATFTISIHIKQDAPEDFTDSFQIRMYFVQWNEAPT